MSDHTADVCTPKPVGGFRAAMGGELWPKLAGCDVHTQLPRPFLVKCRTGVGKRREDISTVGCKVGSSMCTSTQTVKAQGYAQGT